MTPPPEDGDVDDGPDTQRGWADAEVASEFPQLALWQCGVHLPVDRRSPRGVRDELAAQADRQRGATALALRRQPVAGAYRAFFRHIGLDPDVSRTPVEGAVLERLIRGGFASGGLISDGLLIALLRTSIGVWTLDAERLTGRLGIGLASGDARGATDSGPGGAGARLVVADEAGPVATLFAAPQARFAVTRATSHARLFALQVAGVPEIHIEEALWVAASLLSAA